VVQYDGSLNSTTTALVAAYDAQSMAALLVRCIWMGSEAFNLLKWIDLDGQPSFDATAVRIALAQREEKPCRLEVMTDLLL
jgi:hypothetical protein